MSSGYKTRNILHGMLIYGIGDTVASLLLGVFSWHRMVGIMAVAAIVYSWEVPRYFQWIDRRAEVWPPRRARLYRMGLAIAYFNPLWISRHLVFIVIVSGDISTLSWAILLTGFYSFLVNLPFSLAANYLIQNVIPLRHRFLASSSYSALTAVYYAASARRFG